MVVVVVVVVVVAVVAWWWWWRVDHHVLSLSINVYRTQKDLATPAFTMGNLGTDSSSGVKANIAYGMVASNREGRRNDTTEPVYYEVVGQKSKRIPEKKVVMAHEYQTRF